MSRSIHKTLLFVTGVAALLATSALAQSFHPEIPKAWDDKAVAGLELPLAQRDRSPRYMSEAEYYKLTVRPIYRSYPAYAKGREPKGYFEWLKTREPEIIFDPSKLHTKEDWIAAGKLVFESETRFFPAREQPAENEIAYPVAKDGQLPDFVVTFRYYIRKMGVIEEGSNSCAGCHTRIMPDGSFVEGAQGSNNTPPRPAQLARDRKITPERFRQIVNHLWADYGAPWAMNRQQFELFYTFDEFLRDIAARQPGVFARQGTSLAHPVHTPSLIGVENRKYLDATGLVRNRSIGDLMRYAILNEGLDTLAHFGDFQPTSGGTSFSAEAGTRYSDEQLYALALYIESLQPPPDPNRFDAHARRGQQIFRQQGCIACHTPPFYTNNKLTPAPGFQIPDDLRKTDKILEICVGTDPYLALKTRRGTGFYKIPSVRGVWFRNAFGHEGKAETIEEWLDPARLKPDYVPKGFHTGPGPILGHPFGLNLSAEDKRDLIAFLKTL